MARFNAHTMTQKDTQKVVCTSASSFVFASTTSGKSTLAYCAKKVSVCVFRSNVFFVDLLPGKANESDEK